MVQVSLCLILLAVPARAAAVRPEKPGKPPGKPGKPPPGKPDWPDKPDRPEKPGDGKCGRGGVDMVFSPNNEMMALASKSAEKVKLIRWDEDGKSTETEYDLGDDDDDGGDDASISGSEKCSGKGVDMLFSPNSKMLTLSSRSSDKVKLITWDEDGNPTETDYDLGDSDDDGDDPGSGDDDDDEDEDDDEEDDDEEDDDEDKHPLCDDGASRDCQALCKKQKVPLCQIYSGKGKRKKCQRSYVKKLYGDSYAACKWTRYGICMEESPVTCSG